ncbi:hypothetical protein HK405_004966, partial [Cladochytrium tenue]
MWKERNLEKQLKELAADPGPVRTRSRRRRTGLVTNHPRQQAVRTGDDAPNPLIERVARTELKRRSRKSWTDEQDLMIILGFAIKWSLRTSKLAPKISWVSVGKVLDDEPELCRRRYVVLMRRPLNLRLLNLMKEKWPKIWEEGMESGEIPKYEEVKDDWSSYILFFQKTLGVRNL